MCGETPKIRRKYLMNVIYRKTFEQLGGATINISNEKTIINPLEIPVNDDDKKKEAFTDSLQNMYGLIEEHILCLKELEHLKMISG